MKVDKKILGVLKVENRRSSTFSKEDRKLLEILASHTAIALNNLKKKETLAALNTFGRKISKTKNVEELCRETLKTVQMILGFEHVGILLVEGNKLQLMESLGFKPKQKIVFLLDRDKGVTVKAAKTGKTMYVPDVRKENVYVSLKEGVLSELAVPIKLGNKVLGVLNAESRRLDAFDEEDRKLLEIPASHVAVALSNIRKQKQLITLSEKFESLLKSSTEILHTRDVRKRLKAIAKARAKEGRS